MENVICTVVQEKTTQEFISLLNKYGSCTDYNNDYERSKATQGIFVGVINKLYDVVWKGEGGHSEHDTLFISAKSLISNQRESQPFRVGFVGNIVSQLVKVNLKEGDAIGILKPKFFYALDIPTLYSGVGNVVVWIAKDLKEGELNEDVVKSSGDNQCSQSLIKQRNGFDNNKKRIPFLDEDSDSHSLGESSASGTLGHDVQIFRSRPVDLKRSPEVSVNNKLAPDSTTRTVVKRNQNNLCTENKNTPEIVFTENLVSQNTPNVGSFTNISCRNENHCKLVCNLDSAVKSVHKDLCCSSHNIVNNTCEIHSHTTAAKCSCFRINCCNYHTKPVNYFKENCCSCNNRSSCGCFNNHYCSCTKNSFCGHNALPQCIHWSSAHSCHTNNSSCNRHFDHHCRSIKSCCRPCHIPQCCTSHCQNGCIKSKQCHGQKKLDKTSTSCCNKQITTPTHCHNLCCCNHEKINTCGNVKASHCCVSRPELVSQHPEPDNTNEEMSVEFSEDSHKKSRTKEWVHNWVEDPPRLLPEIEASDNLGTSENRSSELRHNIEETGKTCNNQKPNDLMPSNPVLTSNPSDNVSKKKTHKNITKKKKLFSPLDNSTIISAKSVYHNSTIIEESTPFDSDNHTDTPKDGGLTSDKNQEPRDKNINLPLSNNISLDTISDVTHTDPPAAKGTNCSTSFVGERSSSEMNVQESPNANQIQNKEMFCERNRNSSEEECLVLQIETPIISQVHTESQNDVNRLDILNNLNHCETTKADIEISSINDKVNAEQHPNDSHIVKELNSCIEKIDEGNDIDSSFQKASSLHESGGDGKNNLCADENFESNGSNRVEVVAIINKNNTDSSSKTSLALQDHSKSKVSNNCEEMDSRMDFTLLNDKTIDKEGMKRSKESSDDAMELTCESMVMKRRKKDKFRKTRSVGSLSSGRNNDCCTSSTDSFYDARSDGILSIKSNKWCLKPIKEVFDKPNFPLSQKEAEGLSLQGGSSYKLTLFSTFKVTGIIIGILPDLSKENYGNIVKGFCNEGCKKEYSYEDYKEMELLCPACTFCRYSFHLACPGCSISGLKRPLCFYYDFEIHLFDGENVLRIEIFHKSAVHFLGCTPQLYLSSDTLYKKLSKIIFPISLEKWIDPILLTARIKVMPRSGASLLTLEGTSIRKDLTFKGNHYKF